MENRNESQFTAEQLESFFRLVARVNTAQTLVEAQLMVSLYAEKIKAAQTVNPKLRTMSLAEISRGWPMAVPTEEAMNNG